MSTLLIANIDAHLETGLNGLLVGKFSCKLDRHGRLVVPAIFRLRLRANGFGEVGAYAHGNRIQVYPVHRAATSNKTERSLVGLVGDCIAAVTMFEVGKRGTIRLPVGFIEAAGLTDTALVVGMGPYFEIWNPEFYTSRRREHRQPNAQSLACGRSAALVS